MDVLYHEVTARHELERSFDDMHREIIARRALREFWERHADAEQPSPASL
jgi:hypothetical protein